MQLPELPEVYLREPSQDLYTVYTKLYVLVVTEFLEMKALFMIHISKNFQVMNGRI